MLNKNGYKYTDEEVKMIRDFLYYIAEMEYEYFMSTKNKKNEKDRSPLH